MDNNSYQRETNKIHIENEVEMMRRSRDGAAKPWYEVKNQRGKFGEEVVSEINEKLSWKKSAENISTILGLRVNGNVIEHITDYGVFSIRKNTDDLAEILQIFLEFRVERDKKYWKYIADNIMGRIPRVVENGTHIVFRNTSINSSESLKKKELIFDNKFSYEVNNKIRFNYISDEKELDQKALKLLNKIIKNYTMSIKDTEDKKKWIKELFEITGYLLLPKNYSSKAFIFQSIPGTGKSLWLKILIRIIGERNSESYDPQGGEFAEENIYKKRLAYKGELTKGAWTRQTKIQALTSGENIDVRTHGSKNLTWINPKIHFLFLTNEAISGGSHTGMWRRIHLFKFFTETYKIKDQIQGIEERVLSKGFIECVIHFAVSFLGGMFKNNPENNLVIRNEKYVQEQLDNQDMIGEFIKDCVSGEFKINKNMINPSKSEAFGLYKNWLKDSGNKHSVNSKEFNQILEKKLPLGFGYKNRRFTNDTQRKCYNFDMKEIATEELEDL